MGASYPNIFEKCGGNRARAHLVAGPFKPFGPGPTGPNGPGPNGPGPKCPEAQMGSNWSGPQMGPNWSGAQMVFGRILEHMGPFSILAAGF